MTLRSHQTRWFEVFVRREQVRQFDQLADSHRDLLSDGAQRPTRLVGAPEKLVAHSTLTLILNTISFARVGAFALAHGGLSLVVVTLIEAVETPVLWALLFIIGHTTIIILEGLIVFVQTSRLVLFVFFTQFLRADGRFYQPLSSSESPRDR